MVSHADPLRSLIAHFMEMDVAHLGRLHIETGSISRLSLPSADSPKSFSRPRLEFLNLTEHARSLPHD